MSRSRRFSLLAALPERYLRAAWQRPVGGRGVLVLAVAVAGCSTSKASDPAYLLVELVATSGGSGTPKAARAQIDGASGPLTALCVKIGDATAPASFVLQRDPAKDPSQRVTITVAGYLDLAGDTGEVGKEFACPEGMLPTPIAAPQIVSVDFCASSAKKLVFHVGASCACSPDAGPDAGPCSACAADETCGAGLSPAATACGASECCNATVSDACALDGAR